MKKRNPSLWGWRDILLFLLLTAAIITAAITLAVHCLQPEAPERQTVTQYTSHIGGVTRLCMAAKTGSHIDALSCQIVDQPNGELK